MQEPSKNFNPMLGPLGISRSVLSSTTSRGIRPKHVLIVFLILLGIVLAVFWQSNKIHRPLAQALDYQTPLYVNIRLTRDPEWYEPLFFWSTAPSKSPIDAFSASIDFLSWNGSSLLLYFSNIIEFAALPNGEVIMAGRLTNQEQWLALMEVAADTDHGTISGVVNGLVPLLSQETDNWSWFIDNDYLYITSRESTRQMLQGNRENTIDTELRKVGTAGRYAIVYVSEESLNTHGNVYFRDITPINTEYPLIYEITNDAENLVLVLADNLQNIKKIKVSDNVSNQRQELFNLSDASISLYIDSKIDHASGVNVVSSWIQNFSEKSGQSAIKLASLVSEFYNVGTSTSVSMDSEAVFLLSPQNEGGFEWIIAAEGLGESILKDVGTKLFAISHPVTVEETLPDGSTMVDLRANTDNLAWGSFVLPYGGQELSFSSLSGQGETTKYLTGSVQGLGSVLANSETILGKALEESNKKIMPSLSNECSLGPDTSASFRIKGSMLPKTYFNSDLVEYISVIESENQGTILCISLKP